MKPQRCYGCGKIIGKMNPNKSGLCSGCSRDRYNYLNGFKKKKNGKN